MISINAAVKKYGSIFAVNNVSFTVEKGEYFALLGPNGAGKTTMVKMLLGFTAPTSGTLTVSGVPSTDPACRSGVGYLAENLRIPPQLTGSEFLARNALLCGLTKAEARSRIPGLLQTVGMTGKENMKAGTYSKGMAQRIGLAAAILAGAKLLILDEPVSGLDPLGIRDVRRILEDLRATGVTLILNSHLLSEVERICDTVAIINKGDLIVKDSIKNIAREGDSLEDVFIRCVEALPPHA